MVCEAVAVNSLLDRVQSTVATFDNRVVVLEQRAHLGCLEILWESRA